MGIPRRGAGRERRETLLPAIRMEWPLNGRSSIATAVKYKIRDHNISNRKIKYKDWPPPGGDSRKMGTLRWPMYVEAPQTISDCPLALGIAERRRGSTTSTPSLPLSPFMGMPLKTTLAPHKRLTVQSFKVSALSASPSPNYLVKKVSAKELEKLLESERTCPVVVDFYATWCGPCILLAQQLEMLAVEYGKSVLFVKVDTDEEYELAKQLEIRGLPTMVFVSADPKKYAIRTEGLLPNDTIKTLIDTEL